MDYFISQELEKALTTGLLIHLIISSILHCVAFYFLIRETPSSQHAIRIYLFSIQVIIFLFDLSMDLLIEPVPLLPIPAAYLTGVLSRAGVPLAILLAIFVCLAAMMMSSIVLCFLHKHQTLIDSSSIFKLNKHLHNFVYASYFSFCIGSFTVISLWPLDRPSSDAAMKTYAFNITWIQSRGEYVVMEKSAMTQFASLIFLGATSGTMGIINFLCWHIYYTLNSQKSRRSAATQEKVKRSVISLCIQLFVPCIFLGTPLFIDFVSLITNSGDFTACLILFFILPLHSPVHSLLLLSITPAYRRVILSLFESKRIEVIKSVVNTTMTIRRI